MCLTQCNNTFHTKERENVWVQTSMLVLGPNQYALGPNQYARLGPNQYALGWNQYARLGPNQYALGWNQNVSPLLWGQRAGPRPGPGPGPGPLEAEGRLFNGSKNVDILK